VKNFRELLMEGIDSDGNDPSRQDQVQEWSQEEKTTNRHDGEKTHPDEGIANSRDTGVFGNWDFSRHME